MRGLPGWPLPNLNECLAANLGAARLTNTEVFCAGVAINTSQLSTDQAARMLSETSEALGLPCVDPMRECDNFELGGVAPIVDRLL